MLISDFLKDQHGHCDRLFAAAEQAVERGDWTQARQSSDAFIRDTLHHFQIEEEALFPALEQAMGHSQGPTQVMRMEHSDMRQLIEDLQQAIQQQDRNAFAGHCDTLMIMLQQHNAKEEQILYLMADRMLDDQAEQLIQQFSQQPSQDGTAA
ncbi:MAG: hemerythrin domain-containing protein [Gammaproteobacteria bacterium SHHR-1]|uniref:hemerythrin domain-containing protein n=1 Tax=Magnetovirga frankeli TaxID=947516 RepID=UPI001292FF6D|nr:hemerythrin domain-containing protein [gamma proteobacterium SS-5]